MFRTREERLAAFEAVDLYPVLCSEFTLGRPLPDILTACGDGGARIIQLREKNMDKGPLFKLACTARKIADRYNMLLIIDDHVDVALAAGADGVHLGQSDLPVEEARKLGPDLLLGFSTHNLAEALASNAMPTDYVNVGPIFPTRTKNVSYPAVGIEQFMSIIPSIKHPFSVMGGIKERHIHELFAAGARHIAMVTEITQAEDVAGTVRRLRSLFC